MSKTIKNNLFRFVTLRNPQLIDKKEEKPGFVFHPDETSGDFFSAISGASQEDKKDLLKQAGETFETSALKTRTEARSINESLYLFSSWLMRNKNTLTYSQIKENINEATDLDSSQLLSVWDNLIYQTVEKKSIYVREAMIQLLVANQFLNAFKKFSRDLSDDIIFTEDQEKEFVRRANASVVMSKKLFTNTKQESPKVHGFSNSQSKVIDNSIAVALAKRKIKMYEDFLNELKPIEITFNKDNTKRYNIERSSHDKAVEGLIDKATPKIIQRTDEFGNLYDSVTYPGLKIPDFTFVKEEAINTSYLTGKLTDTSFNIFLNDELSVYDSFLEVTEAIKSKIKSEYDILSKISLKNSPKLNIGGAILNLMQRGTNPYCFRAQFNNYASGEHGLILEMATGYPNASITSADFKISNINSNIDHDGLNVEMMDSGENTMTAFFHFNPILIAPGVTFNFTGEFTLNNGETYTFDTTSTSLIRKPLIFNGCSTLTDQTTGNTSPIEVEMFGITNLGIADFRRVEQEVCCYVPGEVSHIENVMAREYKERSTRSLISSEITTEKSEERERENLTDTTTTERNEMQTEISSVINEDQSQSAGGSASVSYSPPMKGTGKLTLNSGAYFDSSSGSSTSNSNSQAQTYAQEVTERAMERIVQKTQTKRTSRILKEFEENNKHGFDNTKGSEHVTGVYRWVDKIYKNKLINYGKRLMYEFAIPEPSRFFKDAIRKQLENNQLESGVIIPEAPIHPSEVFTGINSSNDINETNYQLIAAEYNAEVNNPPVKEMSIGKSFSYTAPSVDSKSYGERNAANADLEIPKGYYAYKAKAKWFDSVDGHHNNSVVIVGSKVMPSNESESYMSKFVDSIPVSFSQLGNLSGSANVDIRLKVLPETEEAWRNETYNIIMEAYNERLQEYNDAQRQDVVFTAEEEEIKFNPLYNRSLEKKELKRIAIELLTAPYNVEVSKDDYQSGTLTKVNRNEAFKIHATAVKFFEQAFDWDIMAYIFYPYFYGKEADWKDLFQAQDAADPLFQGFLQSGMARTVVPVRPGFEDAVNWYMETGEIWNGQGLVVDQDDDLYVSVAEEMQTIEGVVEGTWETRLPTALTILQAESAALLEGGLPCFCDEYSSDNTIMSSSELLGDDDSAGVGVDLLN